MPPILRLSPELHSAIAEFLAQSDHQDALFAWSFTCKGFRLRIAPHLFKKVTLQNNNRSASSLLRVAKGKHGPLVNSLAFTATSPDHCTSEHAVHETGEIFPAAVYEVLSNLRQFPRLTSLTVNLLLELPSTGSKKLVKSFFTPFLAAESDAEVQLAERSNPWRILMARTYSAISENKNSQITSLNIVGLQPREASAFSSPTFHAFLNGLQRFELSFWGTTHRQWRYMNTLDGCLDFRAKLNVFLFDHLKNVTELVLHTNEYSPLGLKGFGHAPLALTKLQMPFLRSVHLSHIFIGSEVQAFFVDRSSTLQSISLHECLASTTADDCISWKTLFTTLSKLQPSSLRHFKLTPLDLRLNPLFGERSLSEGVNELARLEEVPKRIMFAYKDFARDSHGKLCEDTDKSEEAFESGEDQVAYENLMELVRSNLSNIFTGSSR